MKFKGFVVALVSMFKSHWLPFILVLLVLVVFVSAPFLWVYRKAKGAVDKVAPNVLPVK